MGSAAEVRYQRAQLAVTVEEVSRLRALLSDKAVALADAESSLKEARASAGRAERAERAAAATADKERAALADERRRGDTLERELALLRRERDESSRHAKARGSESAAKDVRLSRALEEVTKLKAALATAKADASDAGGAARAEALKAAQENTRLRKRQAELLLALKKQAKLIDVLKRQKLHVEAAAMLHFTEEEFAKTLELGEARALA